jgi:hypothetical protein
MNLTESQAHFGEFSAVKIEHFAGTSDAIFVLVLAPERTLTANGSLSSFGRPSFSGRSYIGTPFL